jgi:hypothetical protein
MFYSENKCSFGGSFYLEAYYLFQLYDLIKFAMLDYLEEGMVTTLQNIIVLFLCASVARRRKRVLLLRSDLYNG